MPSGPIRASERERRGGADMPLCGANKASGGKCKNTAGNGTDHPGYGRCKIHGGSTRSGRVAGARQAARSIADEIKKQMTVGHATDAFVITPEQALIEELKRTVLFVRWLEDMIQQWEPETVGGDYPFELTEKVGGFVEGDEDETPTGSGFGGITSRNIVITPTQRAEWLRVYQTERAHLSRTAKQAIDAGISERLVRLAEQEGAMLAAVVRTVLNRLNLTPEQQQLVPSVVPAVFAMASRGELTT